MSKDRLSLKPVSVHRTAVMGIATVLIAVLHYYQILGAPFDGVLKGLIRFTAEICECGVDIFLFVSGIGLFYSLSKDSNVINFYKKRLKRILPEFALILVIFTLMSMHTAKDSLLFLTGINFWVFGSLSYWYIALLYLLYLMYPLFHRLIVRSIRGASVLTVILTAVLAAVSLCLGENETEIFVALSRIPVFMTGAVTGSLIKSDRPVGRSVVLILGTAAFLCVDMKSVFAPDGTVMRLMLGIIAVFIAVIASLGIDRLKEDNIFLRVMNFLGKITLPFYLINMSLTIYLREYPFFAGLPSIVQIVLSLLLTILLSCGITAVCDLIRKAAEPRSAKPV